MTKFFFIFLLFSFSIGNASIQLFNPVEVVNRYNQFKNTSELAKFIFAFDKRSTSEDRKTIAQYLNSSDLTSLSKASINGSTIILDSKPAVQLQIDQTSPGSFILNGKKIKIHPGRPFKLTFKEIENAIFSTQSKYEFLFGRPAVAGAPAIILGIYGLGALVTGGICSVFGSGFGGTAKEILKVCGDAALKWPKTLWDFIDGIRNGKDIEGGSCVGPSPQNKFGNLVQLKLKDQNTSDIGVYFKTDPKTNLVKLYFLAYDPKAGTYDQIHEKDETTLQYFVGGNTSAAKEFVSKLESTCKTGGTTALNKLITDKPEIKKGLSKLVQDWNDRQQPLSTQDGRTSESEIRR